MNSQSGETNSGAAVRGLLLVLVAVVVGVLLLRSVDDPDEPTTTEPAPPAEPGDALPPTSEAPAPTTTAPPGDDTVTTVAPQVTAVVSTTTTTPATVEGFQPRQVSEVSVQVANSTDVRGAAGRVNDRFKALSYITKSPTNYVGTPLDRTRIYNQPGSLLEARVIAEVLKLDPDNDVFPMLQDTSSVQEFETPDILIALGNDLAE